jgi:hypothetical protein
MSDMLYRRRVDRSFYREDIVCNSSSVIGEVLTWGYESQSPSYFLCEDDLPKFCEEIFEEYLDHQYRSEEYRGQDWRDIMEDVANIVQFAKADYGIEIY